MDPEARRARLERIAKKAAQRQHNQTAELTEIPAAKIEKPYENAPVDLFELNNQLGVDKYLFQGDMDLTEEQLDAVERQMDENGRSKRQAWTFANKWTNNIVYFFFDNDISDAKKTLIRVAHQFIQNRTCISFVESRTAQNRIQIFNGTGCHSQVGMVGGQQQLSIGDGCQLVGIIAHEFTHALGFDHMQSRSDRNMYVTVNNKNIEAGAEGNFELLAPNENKIYTPYEYGSFMHYSANSFAKLKNTFTIVPKDMRYFHTMGNRQISFYDIQMINKHYGCDVKCPSQTSLKCKNGGYPNPSDCSKCNCPAGYGGALCDQKPSGCGETLTASSEWKNAVIKVGDETNYQTSRDAYTTCNHWITAPAGKQIEVQITKITNGLCNYGCSFNGIQIKTDNNTQITNPLVCCDEFTKKIFSSSLNPTPIVSFNRYYVSYFNIGFRYVGGPQPQPAVTTKFPIPTKKPSICVDLAGDQCVQYVQAMGGCANLGADVAKKYCAKSCGYCGVRPKATTIAPSCVDKIPMDCAHIAQDYGCEQFSEKMMKNYCAKSCGYC